MSKLLQPVTAEGLQLPKSLLEECGSGEGRNVEIELEGNSIRIRPAELDEQQIADVAAAYVFERVGDATAVGQPELLGDRWRVPVVIPYLRKDIGHLIYTLSGQLVYEESDSPAQLRARANED